MSRWLRWRAGLDRVVAVLGAIACAPLVLLLAWWVHRADGGPPFVGLPRVGRAGVHFRMHKLRTMRADQPGGAAGGSRITAGDDGRITPVGHWLRSRHLDELPQLVDVARGRMALLGPRPETPGLVDPEDPRWQHVLAVTPGIAGPTQLVCAAWERALLTGPDPEADYRARVLPVKLAVDQWYVAHASPWIDLLVVVSVVQRVLLGRSSTAIERRVHREVPEAARVPVPAQAGVRACA